MYQQVHAFAEIILLLLTTKAFTFLTLRKINKNSCRSKTVTNFNTITVCTGGKE